MTGRAFIEKWLYRLAMASVIAFAGFGIFVLFYPTDARTDAFGVMLLVTLVLGVLAGIVTIFNPDEP